MNDLFMAGHRGIYDGFSVTLTVRVFYYIISSEQGSDYSSSAMPCREGLALLARHAFQTAADGAINGTCETFERPESDAVQRHRLVSL
jgi:hypothetical protein